MTVPAADVLYRWRGGMPLLHAGRREARPTETTGDPEKTARRRRLEDLAEARALGCAVEDLGGEDE